MFKIQGQDAHCQSHNRWREGYRLLYLASQLARQGLNGKSGIFWLRCAISCVRVWVSSHIRSLEKYDKRKRIFEESALSHFWRHGRRGASQGHLALCFLTEGGGHGRGRRVPWNERGENGGIRLQWRLYAPAPSDIGGVETEMKGKGFQEHVCSDLCMQHCSTTSALLLCNASWKGLKIVKNFKPMLHPTFLTAPSKSAEKATAM